MHDADDAQTVHRIVEATKQAFGLRDANYRPPPSRRGYSESARPAGAPGDGRHLNIDDRQAAPWGGKRSRRYRLGWGSGQQRAGGLPLFKACITDLATAWVCCGPAGSSGKYRGASFSLRPASAGAGARQTAVSIPSIPPPHATSDGRVMDFTVPSWAGQPQTRAAIFTRYILDVHYRKLFRARWLLGRTWEQTSDSLKLEGRFAPEGIARLRALDMTWCWPIIAKRWSRRRHRPPSQRAVEGAADPRSSSSAAGY